MTSHLSEEETSTNDKNFVKLDYEESENSVVEWTEHDSSYGAACPCCGSLSQSTRWLLGSVIVGVALLSVLAMAIYLGGLFGMGGALFLLIMVFAFIRCHYTTYPNALLSMHIDSSYYK